jgi:hypothetical protein
MNVYTLENNGRFPFAKDARTSAQALSLLIPKYTSETDPFFCPGKGEPSKVNPEKFAREIISYSYYMGLNASNTSLPLLTDRQVNTNSKETGQQIFSATGNPPANNHSKFGGNFLQCDGQVQSVGTNAPFPLLLHNGVSLLNP